MYGILGSFYNKIGEEEQAQRCKRNSKPEAMDIFDDRKQVVKADRVKKAINLLEKKEISKAEEEIEKILNELETKALKFEEQLRPFLSLLTKMEAQIEREY